MHRTVTPKYLRSYGHFLLAGTLLVLIFSNQGATYPIVKMEWAEGQTLGLCWIE
jgi:hypothetical protein